MRKKQHSRGRPLDGILLLDKPAGCTSNGALQEIKRIYFAQKAGHTGSLDPLATGMLPICFGEATKLSQFLLDADKHYQVTAKLGIKTTTADSEGKIISERLVNVQQTQLEDVLKNFRGEIKQVPSMFSALKHNGQPLYELARQGIEVEREARKVTVHHLELLNFHNDEVQLDVKCTKGTYVRNLVEDIGEALGCGAHVIQLRRLSAGSYDAGKMVTMEYLQKLRDEKAFAEMDALLLPLETAVAHFPAVELAATASFQLQQGNAVQIINKELTGFIQIYDNKQQFIGVGEIDEEGKLAPRRLMR